MARQRRTSVRCKSLIDEGTLLDSVKEILLASNPPRRTTNTLFHTLRATTGSHVNYQNLLLTLHRFWADQGCVIHQPYDVEMGAGTFHPATFLRALGPEPWRAAYPQACRRPTDGRYGENPNRLQHYYQYQVVLKPAPDDIQGLYLESLRRLGIDPNKHDIRF